MAREIPRSPWFGLQLSTLLPEIPIPSNTGTVGRIRCFRHVELPIDPTENDASPRELVQSLTSKAARRRVFRAAEIPLDLEDSTFAELLSDLSEVELRRVASQLRFAGQRTVFYYRVSDLPEVSPDGLTGPIGEEGSPGVYGPEIHTVVRDHGRIYVVCNVPEDGTQLTLSKENRPTTVATFEPRSELLAVRAPDRGTADGTLHAVLRDLDLSGSDRLSFLDDGFRGRFEDACVDGYSTILLRNTNTRDDTREIELRSDESDGRRVTDVRSDAVFHDLQQRSDTELASATGLVSVDTALRSEVHGETLHPRVSIGFPEGRVTFEQFVPEQILLEFDDTIRESL